MRKRATMGLMCMVALLQGCSSAGGVKTVHHEVKTVHHEVKHEVHKVKHKHGGVNKQKVKSKADHHKDKKYKDKHKVKKSGMSKMKQSRRAEIDDFIVKHFKHAGDDKVTASNNTKAISVDDISMVDTLW